MLELDGNVRITGSAGEDIALTGEGGRLRAEIGSLPTGRPSVRLVFSGYVFARRLAKLLAKRDLTLLVTRAGVPLVELGAAARAGFVERLLQLPRVRLYRRK